MLLWYILFSNLQALSRLLSRVLYPWVSCSPLFAPVFLLTVSVFFFLIFNQSQRIFSWRYNEYSTFLLCCLFLSAIPDLQSKHSGSRGFFQYLSLLLATVNHPVPLCFCHLSLSGRLCPTVFIYPTQASAFRPQLGHP